MADSSIEENAAERKFGSQFDDIHILSNAQVAVILQVSAGQAVTRDEETFRFLSFFWVFTNRTCGRIGQPTGCINHVPKGNR